jgi:arylsulfatase A-like enzyme
MIVRMTVVAAALIVGGLAAIAGLWWSAALRSKPPIGVVVVTLDTTRADRLSPYGFNDVSLPHLERLAREGVVFDQATTVAPLTLTAHTSLFTGLLPPNHGVRDNADNALADAHATLAEVLLARGFRTGAFVGSIVLDPARGLKQGFERYQGVPAGDGQTPAPETRQRRADQVMNDAIGWLDTIGGSRFFLWTHLYDAHRPYDPPEPYRSTYGHNLYVGEIAFADSQIGRLLQALDERHLLDRTVVVVVGDHGESLGGHGERDHGIFVYEDVIRVPLIVRAPALRPTRVGEIVRLTDVMPTVLDLLDVPSPPVDGVSVVGLMDGSRRDLDLEAYSESLYPERLGWSSLRALRDGKFKLIDAPRPELYDLEDDPVEEKNIYDQRRALAEQMTARLAAVAKGRGSTSTPQPRVGVSPELQAQLASLGYLGPAGKHGSSSRAARPDPKDCIGGYTRTPGFSPVQPSCGQRRPADEMDAPLLPPPPRR